MKYVIPVVYLDKLTKKINHITNKGGNIVFNVGSERKEAVYLKHIDKSTSTEYTDKFPTYIKVVDVDIEGKYVVNGWEFVATIEHKTSGNIIRAVNSDYKIPDKYYTCGPACEHCHIVRDRKDTYLIYNKDKDEWKQVGKTCLQDFTGGLDAEVCAQYADVEKFIMDCEQLEDYDDYGEEGFGYSNDNSFNGDNVKKIGYNLIKEQGYVKADKSGDSSVGQYVHEYKHDEYSKNIKPASDEEIAKVNAWVEEKSKHLSNDYNANQYMSNAIVAWGEKYPEYRDLALILSLISMYFKDMQEQERIKNLPATNYVGNVGDRIKFKVASYRMLYVKDNSMRGYGAAPTYVYQVYDDKSNTFIVETSSERIEDNWIGKTIEGKVKAQKEYKGVKQTVINRIKLLDESLSIKEALEVLK
jgi:hypothetical protein